MSARTSEQPDDYKALVKGAVLDEETFLRLTLSGRRREGSTPWAKISVRPVLIRGRRAMQFSYFDGRQEIAQNFWGEALQERLDEVLAMPFSHLHVQSTAGDLHIRITRKGKALITTGKPSRPEPEPIRAHNRTKRYPLAVHTPDAFLQAIGIMDRQGRVRPSMQGKFRQINEFLRVVEQTVPQPTPGSQPLHLVDCGCGKAYLTFAAYHFLSDVCGRPVHVVGLDVNEEVINQCCQLRDSLGWDGLEFHVTRIAEFTPAVPPDLVLSLHACDTATDEAIAQGIRWGSRVILAAPCCQHELHRQIRVPLFRPLLRHGILRERLADLLTDTFRALTLRIMGYRTQVIEFVSPEHTSKNLLIRAEKGLKPGDPTAVREYQELKSFWDVSPCLEKLLGEEMEQLLGREV